MDPDRDEELRAVRRGALIFSIQVSNAFSEVALDVLWRVLEDVDVLLAVLPTFKQNVRGRSMVCSFNTDHIIFYADMWSSTACFG